MTNTGTSTSMPSSGSLAIETDSYSIVNGTYESKIKLDTATDKTNPVVTKQVTLSNNKIIKIEVNLKELERRNQNLKANRR